MPHLTVLDVPKIEMSVNMPDAVALETQTPIITIKSFGSVIFPETITAIWTGNLEAFEALTGKLDTTLYFVTGWEQGDLTVPQFFLLLIEKIGIQRIYIGDTLVFQRNESWFVMELDSD